MCNALCIKDLSDHGITNDRRGGIVRHDRLQRLDMKMIAVLVRDHNHINTDDIVLRIGIISGIGEYHFSRLLDEQAAMSEFGDLHRYILPNDDDVSMNVRNSCPH